MERTLGKSKVMAWPDGARVAVMVTILYESWSPGVVPGHSPMVLASPLPPGTPDLQGASWAEYGGETGIWRIAEIFKRRQIRATICTNADVVHRYPDSIRALHAAGHEIAAHSTTQDALLPLMSPEAESATIRSCTEIIAQATGRRPVGWISPRATATAYTAGFLAREGYRWHGDYNDTDLPYVVETEHGKLVALMHSDFTDVRVIAGSPRTLLDVYRDTFDFLCRSGRAEIINLSIHAHFGGRPMVAAVFDQVLDYFSRSEGVWFARHDEVADWILESGG